MKHYIRTAAIAGITSARTLSDNKTVSLEVAIKIINKCEGVLVDDCIPVHIMDHGIIVWVSTVDGRSWESVFSLTGVFRYNRAFKKS